MLDEQLIILMGLPGSGKSSLADKLASEGFGVVAGEDVAKIVFGTEKLKSVEHEYVYALVRQLARELLEDGQKVVIDGTNLRRSYRMKMYDEMQGYKTGLIYLEVDKKTALNRLEKRATVGRGSECSEEVWDDFAGQLEEPLSDEPLIIL